MILSAPYNDICNNTTQVTIYLVVVDRYGLREPISSCSSYFCKL